MNRLFGLTVLTLMLLSAGAARSQDAPRVVQRKLHAMHRASADGNLNKVLWQHLSVSDDGSLLVSVGTQADNTTGILKSNLHENGSLIAVWTLKTGKTVRAFRFSHVLDAVALAPDNKSLVGWGARYEYLPSNGVRNFIPVAYWDFSKPHMQTLHLDMGKEQSVLACGFLGTGKSQALIVVSPRVTQSVAYKFEPPKLIPKPKVEMVLLPAAFKELPRSAGREWDEPVVISRDGKTLAMNSGRNVQVLDVETGEVLSTCEARLGNAELRLPLAISKDGARVMFGVQPAALNEPSTIVVADAKTGRNIATCQGQKSGIVKIAITPDGTRIAATGTDKIAHVWDAASGRELATIPNVAEGATALALSPDGSQLITASLGGDVEVWNLNEVSSKDGKGPNPVAAVDPAQLTAPVLPPLTIPQLEVKSAAFSKAQETLYLTFAARRLLDRAASLAEHPADSAEVKSFLQECAKQRDQARAIGVEAGVVKVFENMPTFWQSLSTEAGKRQQALNENKKLLRELAAEEKANDSSMQLGWFVGVMTAVLGELPMYSNQYDPITRTMLTVESGKLSPAISDFGMSTALNSLFGGLAMKQQLAETDLIANDVLRQVTANSLRRQETLITATRQPLDAALFQQLGGAALIELPVDAPQKPRKSAKDFEVMLAATRDRAGQLKKALNQDEPFAAADHIAVRSLVSIPVKERPKEWFKLAQEMASFVPQVPAGAAYDRDRAALLGMAADLGLRAVALERGSKSWSGTGSPQTLVVLSWLEAALRFDAADQTGILREQKAWALCEHGRLREGYLLAQELKSLRGHSPRYRLQLARAAFVVGRPAESLDELTIGIERLGLSDLNSVRELSDLPKNDPRFKELTTIKFEVVSESVLRGGKARIVNQSSFPITNAKFEMTFPTRRGTGKSGLFVPFLAPGEECRISYNDDYIPRQGIGFKGPENKGSVKVSKSDQGISVVVPVK